MILNDKMYERIVSFLFLTKPHNIIEQKITTIAVIGGIFNHWLFKPNRFSNSKLKSQPLNVITLIRNEA